MKKWTLILIIVITGFSCEYNNTCGISERSHELYLGFFHYSTKKGRVVDFDSVGVSFVDESVFYLDTVAFLPLDLNGFVTDYVLFTDSTDYHLKITYRAELLIENEDCDPVFRVFDLEASSENFDSLSIKVIELTTLLSPHVEIYF